MMANGYKAFNTIVVRLLDNGQIAFCCYYLFSGITVVRGELTMISFSIVFFLPLTFLFLCSLSAVSNSFYLYFFIIFPLFLCYFNAIPFAISVFFAAISPTHSGHLLSLPVYHLPFSPHDQPMYSSSISSWNFPLLQPPLSFHPCYLNSHNYSYHVVFRKHVPSPVVSMSVPSSPVHSCVPG